MKFLKLMSGYLGSLVEEIKKMVRWITLFEPRANYILASLLNWYPERNECVHPMQTWTGVEPVKDNFVKPEPEYNRFPLRSRDEFSTTV